MTARTTVRDLLLLLLSVPMLLGVAPLPPAFTNHGEELGLTQLVEANMVPVWLDVTLDGRPEPVWVTHEGLFSVQPGPDGEPSLIELEAPIAAKTGEGAPLVASTVDVDGDGVLDRDENVNGDGIVNCQVDGEGLPVPDQRSEPSCSDLVYDYNPGCPTQKCL